MVAEASRKGLTAVNADAIQYLTDHPQGFDGIFASHLVEHLPAETMEKLVEQSWLALKPGGRAIFVTPNPGNLDMQLGDFWIDLQHVRFYSPLIMRYVLHRSGFKEVEIGYSDVFRMGPELSYQHIPPFNNPLTQSRWGPSDPIRQMLQPRATKRRLEQLEQRVYDLMTWMQSLYPAGEYFVTGVR
jgi:SAM-dependent methyltransferase